jgi:hypothetical protein
MRFSIDPNRLAAILAESSSRQRDTAASSGALQDARRELGYLQSDAAVYRADNPKADTLPASLAIPLASAETKFATAKATHDANLERQREFGSLGRSASDHAEEHDVAGQREIARENARKPALVQGSRHGR